MMLQGSVLARRFAAAATAIVMLVVLLVPGRAHGAAGDGIEGVEIGLKKKPGGQLSISMAQAFTECAVPNTATEDSTSACDTPQTFHQQAGSPAGGWTFSAEGSVTFRAKTSDKNKISSPLNPADSADVNFQIKGGGILNGAVPATDTGTLLLVLRESRNDRTAGDVTIVDTPISIPVPVVDGKISVKKSLNEIRNAILFHGAPRPFLLQIISIELLDPNGNLFAVPALGLQ